MSRLLLILIHLLIIVPDVFCETFTVTTTADYVPGSFRAALAETMKNAGEDTIQFSPALAGQSVTVTQYLGSGTESVIINTDTPNGSVDIAVSTGLLVVQQNLTWLGSGRILLGATSGSDSVTLEFGGVADRIFTAPIVVRAGSTGEKTIFCVNNNNSTVTLTGSITMLDSLTVFSEFGSNVVLTGEVSLGSKVLTSYCKGTTKFSGRVWNSDPASAGKMSKIRGGSLYLTGEEDNTRLMLELMGGTVYLQKTSSPTVHAFGGGLGEIDSKNALGGSFGSVISSGPDQIADNVSIFAQSSGTDLIIVGDETIDALTSGQLASVVGNNATLTIGAGNGSGTFAGSLSNELSIKKIGTGVQTLTAPMYNFEPMTGSIVVTQGTLNVLSNLSSNSWAQVDAGATISGTGVIPTMNLRTGAVLAPGDARLIRDIGTINIGTTTTPADLIWNSGGTVACDLSASSNNADRLNISGNLIKGPSGSYQFDFGGSGLPRRTYILATFANTSFVASDFTYTSLAPGLEGSFSIVNNTELQFTTGRLPFQVTTTLDSGLGSLRQAILDAANASGSNTVTFDPSLSGLTISLVSELSISDPEGVSIDGTDLPMGVAIGGNGATRLFHIVNDSKLTIKGLTLQDGAVPSGGGAVQISDQGSLTLTGCTLVRNRASTQGGAIHLEQGAMGNISRCTFSENEAPEGSGGAISNSGTLSLTHCTITNNSADFGGGLANNAAGTLSITNSIFAENHLSGMDEMHGRNIINWGSKIELSGMSIIEALESDDITGSGSLLLEAPLLSLLGNFGGPTQTMALRLGSPARNAAGVTADDKDQRGFPLINLPDIGAYESENRLNCASYLAETLPLSATSLQMNPGYDFDGDGATNEQEWAAFTNPANSASKFRVISAGKSSKNFSVFFTTEAGKSYTLWQAETLSGPWQSAASFAIVGTGTPKQFTVPMPTTGPQRRFYRVEVSMPP